MPTLNFTPNPTLVTMARRCGYWPTARHCRNLDIEFEDCYLMLFGRYPVKG